MIGGFKKVLLLLIIPLFLLFLTSNVKADEIKNNIIFNGLNDYNTFEFKLNNKSNNKYTIEEIKNNNDNKILNMEYSYNNKEITSKSSSTISIKILYKNLLKNVEEERINNLIVTIILAKANIDKKF